MQLLVCVNFHRSSRTLVIAANEPLSRLMQADKSAQEFGENDVHPRLTLHFSLVICLALCSPPPPPLPYNMMVSLLPGNLVCDVVHTSVKPKRRKKIDLWQDMMTYPGTAFHWPLCLIGEDDQTRYVCAVAVSVCAHSFWWCVYTPGPVLWYCDAECHRALAWALQPKKPAVKLTSLSSALTYTLPCPRHTRTNTHREVHTHTHTLFQWPQV